MNKCLRSSGSERRLQSSIGPEREVSGRDGFQPITCLRVREPVAHVRRPKGKAARAGALGLSQEDAMIATFRETLMATTLLAGLAIFSFDTAQAGPNGPSFGGGSISGISSMRMDFNPRISGPGGALSHDD